jgi:mannose-1-phosphate guanylyltransferase
MIQMTVDRLLPFLSPEDIYIVTNEDYLAVAHEQLPEIPAENILIEPMPRDTAPCVGYACAVLRTRYEDAVMFVLASDHLIRMPEMYLSDLRKAARYIEESDALLTIGIPPTSPEVGYGYIKYDPAEEAAEGFYSVARFVEKPSRETAERFLAEGGYLWNSGMFAWRLRVIDGWYRKLAPEIYRGMQRIAEACAAGRLSDVLADVFSKFPRISVDYAIMEHAANIRTIPASFAWLDIGNWNVLDKIRPVDESGNVVDADAVLEGCENLIVSGSGGRLISLIGLKNIVVVDTEDVLLVSHRDQLAKIKDVLSRLRAEDRRSVL